MKTNQPLEDMHILASSLQGDVKTWMPNPNSQATTALVLSSTQISETHEALAELDYFVQMTGKTYKKPDLAKGESEPFVHSWFVPGHAGGTWFVVKFLNTAVALPKITCH